MWLKWGGSSTTSKSMVSNVHLWDLAAPDRTTPPNSLSKSSHNRKGWSWPVLVELRRNLWSGMDRIKKASKVSYYLPPVILLNFIAKSHCIQILLIIFTFLPLIFFNCILLHLDLTFIIFQDQESLVLTFHNTILASSITTPFLSFFSVLLVSSWLAFYCISPVLRWLTSSLVVWLDVVR